MSRRGRGALVPCALVRKSVLAVSSLESTRMPGSPMTESLGTAAYAGIVASSAIGVIVFDRAGAITARNPTFERMVALHDERGGTLGALADFLSPSIVAQLLELCDAHASRVSEVTCQKSDGSSVDLLMATVSTPTPGGGGLS